MHRCGVTMLDICVLPLPNFETAELNLCECAAERYVSLMLFNFLQSLVISTWPTHESESGAQLSV
jgi:hypothetical protein